MQENMPLRPQTHRLPSRFEHVKMETTQQGEVIDPEIINVINRADPAPGRGQGRGRSRGRPRGRGRGCGRG
jgi:hypothetical protein